MTPCIQLQANIMDCNLITLSKESCYKHFYDSEFTFGHKSWNFVISHLITNFAPELYEICKFAITEKPSICAESPDFPVFSAKCRECKIEKRDSHGKLRNGHGKVMEKYVVKSVGTLIIFNTSFPSRFVNRTARHPVLRNDQDFRDFLEKEGDLPKSTSTSALSGAGVKRLFSRVGDSLGKMTFKMDETDQVGAHLISPLLLLGAYILLNRFPWCQFC